MTHTKLLTVIVSALLLAIVCIGCAQNAEPSNRFAQENTGPTTPQRGTVINHIYAGDVYNCPMVASSQPADVADADRTPLVGKTDQNRGTASSQGPRNGRVHTVNLWVDQSGSAAPSVGSMNPNGSQAQNTTSEQKPEASVQASVPVNVGPGSRSQTDQTQAYKGDASGGPVNADQSGDSLQAFLKANADNPFVQGFMQLYQAWASKKPAASTQPAQ